MTRPVLIGQPVSQLPTPAVLVDLSRLRRNITAMAAQMRALHVKLRPHWKTSKSAQVASLQLAAGAIGLTAATAAEATALADNNVENVFWAYPPIGPDRIIAALSVARRSRLTVGVDSAAAITPLAAAAATAGLRIDVRLEIDTGLGRMGVRPEEALVAARALGSLDGVRLTGVYTHEGQVQGVGADSERRFAAGRDAGRATVQVAKTLRDDGFDIRDVSVGSTAGAWSAPTVAGVTEARPGTYVYGDENQVAIGTMAPSQVALTVLSRVISTERGEPVIIDAGIKALSSDKSAHGDGRIGTLVSDDRGTVSMGHEEHGFLEGTTGLRVGDLLQLRPNHACGTVNMHSRVFVVDDGAVVDVWPVLARH